MRDMQTAEHVTPRAQPSFRLQSQRASRDDAKLAVSRIRQNATGSDGMQRKLVHARTRARQRRPVSLPPSNPPGLVIPAGPRHSREGGNLLRPGGLIVALPERRYQVRSRLTWFCGPCTREGFHEQYMPAFGEIVDIPKPVVLRCWRHMKKGGVVTAGMDVSARQDLFRYRDIHSTGLNRIDRLCVALGREENEIVDRACEKEGTTKSEFIRRAIGYAILNMNGEVQNDRLPRGGRGDSVTFHMSSQEIEALDTARGGVSRSAFVRYAVQYIGENLRDADAKFAPTPYYVDRPVVQNEGADR